MVMAVPIFGLSASTSRYFVMEPTVLVPEVRMRQVVPLVFVMESMAHVPLASGYVVQKLLAQGSAMPLVSLWSASSAQASARLFVIFPRKVSALFKEELTLVTKSMSTVDAATALMMRTERRAMYPRRDDEAGMDAMIHSLPCTSSL